jgi:hypothetical protein
VILRRALDVACCFLVADASLRQTRLKRKALHDPHKRGFVRSILAAIASPARGTEGLDARRG